MQAKSQFLKARIQYNNNNSQKLWCLLGDVLYRLPTKILPSIKPPQLLEDRFVEFFTGKITKINSTLSTSLNSQHITPDSPLPIFFAFSTVTEDQVTKMIINCLVPSTLGPLSLFLIIWIFSSPPLPK